MDKIRIHHEPFVIIWRDFFPRRINQQIFAEAVSHSKYFVQATVSTPRRIDLGFRSNKSALYDDIFVDRNSSVLLKYLDWTLVEDGQFRQILSSSPYPFHELVHNAASLIMPRRTWDSTELGAIRRGYSA
jgi:hypothetical protein